MDNTVPDRQAVTGFVDWYRLNESSRTSVLSFHSLFEFAGSNFCDRHEISSLFYFPAWMWGVRIQ